MKIVFPYKRWIPAFFLFFLFLPFFAQAQTLGEIQAQVLHVVHEQTEEGQSYTIIQAVDKNGETYRIDSREEYLQEGIRYDVREGQRVLLQLIDDGQGGQKALFIDVIRTRMLLWIFLLFAFIIILVGRLRGLFAIGGLIVTLSILFGSILPLILKGYDPV